MFDFFFKFSKLLFSAIIIVVFCALSITAPPVLIIDYHILGQMASINVLHERWFGGFAPVDKIQTF